MFKIHRGKPKLAGLRLHRTSLGLELFPGPVRRFARAFVRLATIRMSSVSMSFTVHKCLQ